MLRCIKAPAVLAILASVLHQSIAGPTRKDLDNPRSSDSERDEQAKQSTYDQRLERRQNYQLPALWPLIYQAASSKFPTDTAYRVGRLSLAI